MKPKILTEPQKMLAALREYFVQQDVETFERDEETSFGFITRFDDTPILVHADFDSPALRVRLETTLLCDNRQPPAVCEQLANAINGYAKFVGVRIDRDHRRFALESGLLLGDGFCLHAQLMALATSHMVGVAQFAPMLGRFSRRETSLDECHHRLHLLAAVNAQEDSVAPVTDPDGREWNLCPAPRN